MKLLCEQLKRMATAAAASGDVLEVSEIRFAFCGIPAEINEEYVYFQEGWEVESTGQISGKPKVEAMFKGHTIPLSVITGFRICKHP